jgi:hypothetical protein
MFSILLNDVALDVNPGQHITLESESNLFTDTLKADGSELISLATTPRNLRALGHADVIEIEPQSEAYPCLLTLGLNTYPATLRIQEVSATGINAYVLYNMASLTCFGKNCRDFDWTVSTFWNTFIDQYQLMASYIWPDTPFYFPLIINPIFFDDADTDPVDKLSPHFEGIINKHTVANGSLVWVDNYVDGQTGQSINRNTAVPMIPLCELLTRAFALDGYAIQGDFMAEEDIRKLFIYNNRSIDEQVSNPALSVFAENSLGYTTGFSFQKIDFATSNNSFYFSAAQDEYTVHTVGTFTFTLSLTIGQISGNIQLSKVHAVLNGTTLQSIGFSGGGLVSGTYDFAFTFGFVAGQLGQKLQFQLGAFQGGGFAQISHIKLTVGPVYASPLYAPKVVTTLADHAPDMLFSEFFTHVVKAFQLHPTINIEQKIVHLNYSITATALRTVRNLDGAALLPVTQEWLTPKRYAFAWANSFYEGIHSKEVLRQSVFEPSGQVAMYPTKREGIDAVELGSAFSLLEMQTLADSDLPTEFTCYAVERGRHSPLELLEKEKEIRLGMYQPKGLYRYASLFGNTLSLILGSNQYSITGRQQPWLHFMQRSKRLFKVDINPLHPQAHSLNSGDAITLLHNVFIVQKLTRTYSAGGVQKISLELRKV